MSVLMVEAMTEQEFITGVANGTLLNVDVIKYCVEAKRLGANLNDILDEMFAQTLSYHIHQIAFVEGTDEAKDYGGVSMADQAKINRLCDAMGLIEARFGIVWGNSNERQRAAENGLYLPSELLKYKKQVDTPRARKYFAKAISKGLIEKTESGYRKSNGISKAQLAYFLQNIYVTPTGGGTFPNTALSLLFGVSGLKQAASKLADNKNTEGKPKGHQVIDDIFSD